MRNFLVLIAGVVVAGAVAGAGAAGGPAPGIMQGGTGVVSSDGAVRYVTYEHAGSTIVTALGTKSGMTLRWKGLSGSYGIPLVAFDGTTGGLTPDGRTLVLGSPFGNDSHFAVLDTEKLRLVRTIDLKGGWAYDAISPNGRILYLIQYHVQSNSIDYAVRAYDLAAGRLFPKLVVDPKEPDEPMVGSPVARATGPRGAWVYTLYATSGAPFVHALDAVHRKAVCIDLPWKAGDGNIGDMRLTLSADGRRLMVHQRGQAPVFVVDTTTFKARSTNR
jgi:hypothetical protein